MRRVAPSDFDVLAEAARGAPRRRRNLNLHATDAAPCQRLFNAIEPDSYIPPHRHADPAKDETFLWVRGRLGAIEFEDDGAVAGAAILAPDESLAVTIPAGRFHTIFAMESGSVFFEAKAGPYRPLGPDERAAWAPPEGGADGAGYLRRLKSALHDAMGPKGER